MTRTRARTVPSDQIGIRPLRQADLPSLREILFDRRVHNPLALAAPTVRIAIDEYLTPRVRDRRGPRFLVATCNGDEAAVGAGRIQDAHIDYFVAPAWWGRGIGSKLAASLCVEAFGALGLTHVYASVLRQNAPSRRILERLAFERVNAGAARAPRRACPLTVLEYVRNRGDGCG